MIKKYNSRKKGIVGYALVGLIIFLLIAVIMFRLQGAILGIIRTVGDDQPCAWSAIMNSYLKVGGVSTSSLKCPTKFISIGLEDDDDENVVGIDRPISSKKLREKLLSWNYDREYLDDDFREYRMDEIVANEMRSCWNKLGRGELSLFNGWFSAISYEEGTWTGQEGRFKTFLKTAWPGNKDYTGAPRACVICSRINFNEDIRNIKPAEDDSLTEWTRRHPVNERSSKPISYYEFLKDDVFTDDLFGENSLKYKYASTQPYAVLFVRVNVFYLLDTASSILSKINIGEEDSIAPINAVYLVPFSEINNECDKIMN